MTSQPTPEQIQRFNEIDWQPLMNAFDEIIENLKQIIKVVAEICNAIVEHFLIAIYGEHYLKKLQRQTRYERFNWFMRRVWDFREVIRTIMRSWER